MADSQVLSDSPGTGSAVLDAPAYSAPRVPGPPPSAQAPLTSPQAPKPKPRPVKRESEPSQSVGSISKKPPKKAPTPPVGARPVLASGAASGSAAPAQPPSPKNAPAAQSSPQPQQTATASPRSLRSDASQAATQSGEEVQPGVGLVEWFTRHRQALATYFISLVFHGLIVLVAWFVMIPQQVKNELLDVLVKKPDVIDNAPELIDIPQPEEMTDVELNTNPTEVNVMSESDAADTIDLNIDDLEQALEPEIEKPIGPSMDNVKSIAHGRSEAAKARASAERGGNAASDAAVASGLTWIASVQRKNGSWSFNDIGKSSGPGNLKECYNGATALALMAYLGAGHTHEKKGKYQATVKRGLNYLLKSYKQTPGGLDFRGKVIANEGMYVQGLVAITLCEAHGMTKDRRLRRAADGALQFVMSSQHPSDGGWRYSPNAPGDTSVVGWMLMGLKSGYQAKIRIPPNITQGVKHFLDQVSRDNGAKYAYMPAAAQKAKPSTTAIGLLCRMYLGWKHDHEALTRGVKYLAETRPSRGDMYYNYYATQVMIQWTGAKGQLWNKWNGAMRDWLVQTQKKGGPEKGSWDVRDVHGARGGRLYMTCLAVMTLEVYYRVLPLYKRASVQADF